MHIKKMPIVYAILVLALIEVSECCLASDPPCCPYRPCDFHANFSYYEEPTWDCRKPSKDCQRPLNSCAVPVNKKVPHVMELDRNDQLVKFTASIVSRSDRIGICSGTIIAPSFILTTAFSCVRRPWMTVPYPADHLEVKIHGFVKNNPHTTIVWQYYLVERVLLHNLFFTPERKLVFKNDIALVKTQGKMTLTEYNGIARIPLSRGFLPDTGRWWFIASFNSELKNIQNNKDAIWSVKTRHVDRDICRSAVNNSNIYNYQSHICAGYYHKGSSNDKCRKDYGAPLSYNNCVIGILALKFACGAQESAGAFLSVASQSSWIMRSVEVMSDYKEWVSGC